EIEHAQYAAARCNELALDEVLGIPAGEPAVDRELAGLVAPRDTVHAQRKVAARTGSDKVACDAFHEAVIVGFGQGQGSCPPAVGHGPGQRGRVARARTSWIVQ